MRPNTLHSSTQGSVSETNINTWVLTSHPWGFQNYPWDSRGNLSRCWTWEGHIRVSLLTTSGSSSGRWLSVTDGCCSLRLPTLDPLHIPRDDVAMETQLIVILRSWYGWVLVYSQRFRGIPGFETKGALFLTNEGVKGCSYVTSPEWTADLQYTGS
jgi:hypothetical protein